MKKYLLLLAFVCLSQFVFSQYHLQIRLAKRSKYSNINYVISVPGFQNIQGSLSNDNDLIEVSLICNSIPYGIGIHAGYHFAQPREDYLIWDEDACQYITFGGNELEPGGFNEGGGSNDPTTAEAVMVDVSLSPPLVFGVEKTINCVDNGLGNIEITSKLDPNNALSCGYYSLIKRDLIYEIALSDGTTRDIGGDGFRSRFIGYKDVQDAFGNIKILNEELFIKVKCNTHFGDKYLSKGVISNVFFKPKPSITINYPIPVCNEDERIISLKLTEETNFDKLLVDIIPLSSKIPTLNPDLYKDTIIEGIQYYITNQIHTDFYNCNYDTGINLPAKYFLTDGYYRINASFTDGCKSTKVIKIEPKPDPIKIESFQLKAYSGKDDKDYHIIEPNETASATLTITGRDGGYILDPAIGTLTKIEGKSNEYVITNIKEGKFNFQVSDNNECKSNIVNKTINKSTPVQFNDVKVKPVSCLEYKNGEISFSIKKGSWEGYDDSSTNTGFRAILECPDGTTKNESIEKSEEDIISWKFENLIGGKYTLKIEGLLKGYYVEYPAEIEVEQSEKPLFIESGCSDINCYGDKGEFWIKPGKGHGTPPYKLIFYEKDANGNNIDEPAIQLKEENDYLYEATEVSSDKIYYYVIEDKFGCRKHAGPIDMRIPKPLVLSHTSTPVKCKGGKGTFTLIASGGTPPYNLSGSNISEEIELLETDNYSYTVNDALPDKTYSYNIVDKGDCSSNETVKLSEPEILSLTKVDITKASCLTASNGSIVYTLKGGHDIDVVEEGKNKLTVTLKRGTTAVVTERLFEGRKITISGLEPGDYNISVGNGANCTEATDEFKISTIDVENQFKITSVEPTPASCDEKHNGEIKISVANGKALTGGKYKLYLDNDNSKDYLPNTIVPDIDGNKSYTVKLTDANNCSAIKTGVKTGIDPNTLKLAEPEIIMPTCNTATNGKIVLHGANGLASDGSSPSKYLYSFNGGTFESRNEFINQASKSYTYSVMDGIGCVVHSIVDLTTDEVPISFDLTATDESCDAADNGKIEIKNLVHKQDLDLTYTLDGADKTPTDNYYLGLDGRESLYNVRISDVNNCFSEKKIKLINQKHLPSISKTIIEKLACESASNGAIDVDVSTSYPSVLTYVLNDDKGQPVMAKLDDDTRFEGLNKQNYEFIANDENNCSSSLPIKIPLSTDAIHFTNEEWIPATCNTADNGIIKVEASGGVLDKSGYTFVFKGTTPDGTTVELNGILVGTEGKIAEFKGLEVGTKGSITVIDGTECTAETVMKTVEVRSDVLQITSFNKTHPICYNTNTGEIKPTVKNAIGTLTYSIEKKSGSNYFPITSTDVVGNNGYENLDFGIYKITVEDTDACIASYEGIKLLNPQEAEVTASKNNFIIIKGEQTGEYEITLVGINKSFTYVLNKLVSGEADVEIESGKLFYDTGFEIVKKFEYLTAGKYRFILKDDNSCLDFKGSDIYAEEFTIHEPEFEFGITNESITNVSCNGLRDGAISLSGYGGWGEYSYSLDGFDWQKNGTFNNLKAGAYSIQIKDREGVVYTHPFNISEPKVLSVSIDKLKDATCPNYANGHVIATSQNGIPFTEGLKYRIENTDDRSMVFGDTHSDNSYEFKQLPKGNYELFVSDSHSCVDSKPFLISEPERAQIEYTNNYIKAKGDATGEISLLINGGNGLFDYKCILDDAEAAFETGQTTSEIELSSLLAGSYKILVRDIEACVYEGTSEWMARNIEILEPELSLGFEIEQKSEVSCNGLSDGSLELKAVGGWGDYSFQLDGADPVLTSHFSDLKAGIYRINIIDKAGINWEHDIEIKEPKLLEAAYLSHKDANCFNDSDGEIELLVNGGNSAYQLSVNGKDWTDGVTIGGLSTKLYNVQVRDARGCETSVDNIQINQPEEITRKSWTIIEPRCLKNTGSISAEFTGGVGAFKYKWEIEMGDDNFVAIPQNTNAEINELFSGRYQLTVTDEHGCNKSFSFPLGDISDLTIQDIAVTDVSCYGYSDGSAVASVIKGNPDYTYSWDPKIIESDKNRIWNTPAGQYDLLVKDSKGCKSTGYFVIDSPEALSYNIIELSQPLCYGGTTGKIQLTGIGGTPEYKYLWTGGSRETGIENLKPGKYTLQLLDSHSCKSEFDFEMAYQRSLKPFIGNDTLICSYNSLPLYGGDYSKYSWTSESGFQSVMPNVELTEPDLYYLKVEDEDNCLGFDTLRVDKSYLNIESLEIKDVSCYAFADASAQVAVSPDGWEHTIIWPDGSGANLWDHIEGGSYQVQVKDEFNCQDTRAFLVNEPDPLGLEIENLFHPLCDGVPDGFIRLNPYGGNGDYSYLWEHGDDRKRLSGLDAGEYKVHVSDKKACEISKSFSLAYQRTIIPDLGEDITVCTNNYVNLFPGVFDEYKWISNGKVLGTDSELIAWQTGDYSVEVKDQDGCIASDQIKLTEKESELAPILLAASSVALGDTLMVLEVSQPKPESLTWKFSGSHTITEEGSFYCKVVFSEEGMFDMKLTALLDGCIGETQESILVLPANTEEKDENASESYIHLNKLTVFPNPSDGQFDAKVELNEVADITFYLVNIRNGQIIEKRDRKGLKTYQEAYNVSQAGVYCIYAVSRGERKVFKLVVI